jgi:hypothetical protein
MFMKGVRAEADWLMPHDAPWELDKLHAIFVIK